MVLLLSTGRPLSRIFVSLDVVGRFFRESRINKLNKRKIGTAYELRAAAYLKKNGYRILELNFRCRQGEIDLIARDGTYLVFIEVKYRSSLKDGDPLEAVDRRKQKKIIRVAEYYLCMHPEKADLPCRFDVIGIEGKQIRLIRNAFDCGG